MGQKRAYVYVERILKLHRHTAECTMESPDVPCEIETWRASEKKLFARLTELNNKWNFDLTIRDTSKKAQCGDVMIENSQGIKTVWDCKHYSGAVPWKEMKKLARDARLNGAAFAVMLTTTSVARTKCFTVNTVDGVPIHVTKLNSPGEFACLYLSTLNTISDETKTQSAAKSARLFQLVSSMEQTIQELKKTLA